MGVGGTALGMEVSVGNGVSRGNGVEVGLVTGGGLVAIAVGRKVGGGAEVTVTVAVGASFWVGGWVGVPPPQAKTPRDINVAPVVRQSFALRPNLNSLFLKKMK
mgnify:CR=1 FL=1